MACRDRSASSSYFTRIAPADFNPELKNMDKKTDPLLSWSVFTSYLITLTNFVLAVMYPLATW